MQLLSFKKPFSVGSDGVVINNLAYNHKYKRKGNHLVVEVFDPITNKNYQIFYSLNGIFEFVRVSFNHYYFASDDDLATHYVFETKILKSSGDYLLEKSDYVVSDSQNKLQLKSRFFESAVDNETSQKEFLLDNGCWKAKGNIPKKHFAFWNKH